jgi:phosphatidylglycerophosphatase A
MEPLGDGLQLVGFVVVTAMVLASLVAVAIGITVFLYMSHRKIVIIKKGSGSHEAGREAEHIPAEVQS